MKYFWAVAKLSTFTGHIKDPAQNIPQEICIKI